MITIIILIILAAVTLKALFNEDLVATAIKAGEDYRRAEGQEMSELDKINNLIKNAVSGDVKMQIEPTSITMNSIGIKVKIADDSATNLEEPTYRYYIKKAIDAEYPKEAVYAGSNTICDFTGLEENVEYDILVTVIDKNQKAGKVEKRIKTISIPVFTQETAIDNRDESSMTISAIAANAARLPITYTLYYGTDENNLTAETPKTLNSEEKAEFTINTTKTDTYYVRIDAKNDLRRSNR